MRCIFFIALASSGFERSSAAFEAFCIHRRKIGTFAISRDHRPQVAAALDPPEQGDDAEQDEQPEEDPDRNQERRDVAEHSGRWY